MIDAAVSLDVGSVRLTERHVRTDPPTPAELDAVRADIDRILDGAPRRALEGPLVGVAGTVTTIAAIARGVDPYDASRIHGVELTIDEVRRVSEHLSRIPLAERVTLPGLSPKRADVIVAGAALCLAILERAGAPSVHVSDRGVRWGLAAELARR
jgi:exopolyphosphatase/guanosine-5'-triphosphate,3'-diphosphate pyrophosphatase